ncbi:MAG: DUF6268 family outer membrane beta-barrel protein [Bacteroidota bacterium]
MRGVFLAIFILLSFPFYAQEMVLTPLAGGFCKPGVINKSPSKGLYLSYFARPRFNFTSNSGENRSTSRAGINDRINIKLKAPIINKENFKFLIGAAHMREEYEFQRIDGSPSNIFSSINSQTLKTSRLSAYFLKSINNRLYATLKLEASYNGDYDNLIDFGNRYAIYRGAFLMGYKPRPDTEWGFGGMFSKGFRRTRVYPFVMYNKTFNENWGLETILPVKIMMRYNISPSNLVLFGTQFNSRSYSIDVFGADGGDPSSDIYHMRSSEIQFNVEFQQRISKWVWLEAKAGYAKNFTSRFDRISPVRQENFITADPSSGPFFQFGIFVSPPRDCER